MHFLFIGLVVAAQASSQAIIRVGSILSLVVPALMNVPLIIIALEPPARSLPPKQPGMEGEPRHMHQDDPDLLVSLPV